ncbi:DUF305 domain-containing protein [Brevundimonas sp. FT23028]|uniref:DUF305 domain-containing protein n=1 Tax=Brevundimonas sp. FT23028 TaxID=3393748 RepID=UPI003B58ACE5
MRVAPGLIALMLLAACDGGGDPVQQALRETAAANHSAVVRETATVEPAVSRSPDQERVDAMLADRRASRADAERVLRDTRDPELRRLAQAAAESRTREIAELEAWRPADQSAVSR